MTKKFLEKYCNAVDSWSVLLIIIFEAFQINTVNLCDSKEERKNRVKNVAFIQLCKG